MKTQAPVSASSFGAKTSNGKAVATPKVQVSVISLSQMAGKINK